MAVAAASRRGGARLPERRAAATTDANRPGEVRARTFALGVTACAGAVLLFLALKLTTWPPHEDETLALWVGRAPIGELLDTVLGQRGGAPLHFLVAWLVAHAGGDLTELRLLSALFAVASVPVVALLAARLAGRTVALTATAIVSASWVLLFHGIYGRMYSLFLLTSALSYLALLVAVERGGRRAWVLWALALLATVASHPYGALVLASQGLFVLVRRGPMREALLAFAAVGVVGIPFWYTDLVLAGRFDVTVGAGGEKLGSPLSVLEYLARVAGDFTAGWWPVLACVLVAAAVGLRRLASTRPPSATLVAVVFAVPTLALLLARFGGSTSPESRHLIFVLPFFAIVVAYSIVELAGRRRGRVLAAAALTALLAAQVGWARSKTPAMFAGEPAARIAAREAASAWLARTSRPADILFGYEPVYLGAWERSPAVSRTVVPRADAKLALAVLREAPRPLGRGVWLFDAGENNNFTPKPTIPVRRPWPRRDFEANAFGPYLIVRTREPSGTPRKYLDQASQAMLLGKSLAIGDADVNFVTVRLAAYRLDRSGSGSASPSSR